MQGRADVREFALSSGIEEESIEKARLQKISGWIKGQSGEEPGPEGKVYESKARESEQDKGPCLTVRLKALCRRNFFEEAGKSAVTLGTTLGATGVLGAIGAKHLGPTGSLVGMGLGAVTGAIVSNAMD